MSDVEVRIATPEDASVVGRVLWEFNTECETPTPSAEGARHPVHPVAGSGRGSCPARGPGGTERVAYLTLLQRGLRLCRERSAGEMQTNVNEADTDSRRFYERHGFLNVLPGTNCRMLFYEQEL
jgi:hypothetical protein